MSKADIGLIGLAVMGENLVMNMESKGFQNSVLRAGLYTLAGCRKNIRLESEVW